MKHKLIILIALLSVSLYAKAQEYRLAKSNGHLRLNITGIIVEGYDGKDIIFSGEKVVTEEPTDERARGLVPISNSKHTDNTGLGINVIENGQDVNVNLVAKKPIGIVTIKVPNTIKVSIVTNNSNGIFYSFSTNSNANNNNTTASKPVDEIVLRNLKSEIEVSVSSNKIRLENNTGPMNIKTVSGPVEAVFNSDIKGPVSIISVTNYVDVTLPASTKANIEMGTNYGKLYAGKEFKIDLDKVEEEDKYAIGYRATPLASRTVTGVQIAEATRATLNAKGENRSAAKSPKAGDTVAIKEIIVNGQHITALPKGTIQIQGLEKLTGTVNGIQINGDGIASTYPTAYTYRSLLSRGDRIKGKLNGGGIDLIFKSTNKNVYLRQQ